MKFMKLPMCLNNFPTSKHKSSWLFSKYTCFRFILGNEVIHSKLNKSILFTFIIWFSFDINIWTNLLVRSKTKIKCKNQFCVNKKSNKNSCYFVIANKFITNDVIPIIFWKERNASYYRCRISNVWWFLWLWLGFISWLNGIAHFCDMSIENSTIYNRL